MIDVNLLDTRSPQGLDKQSIIEETVRLAKKIGELQHILYADGKQSVLVILQGVDASGKDGTAKNVFDFCNPSGIDFYSFKKPSEIELAHDFLWRCHMVAPRKGQIMVFIRSHYEDILVQRVHNWISEERAELRMKAINAFEQLLIFDNNTAIIKFFLNISYERQERKLQERLDDPRLNWKHNDADWEERKHWAKYMECYNFAINQSVIPWYIVPADQKWYRNYFVAKTVLEHLEKLDMKLPVLKR